ncbi:MAG: 5-(carboxyamino)imidazole ribonucleotide mutase [Omnitrophica bacterium RIFCSPLOWO2_12_FULL_44_17]|uniref:N5-carboxyaminoimidazole ribonucleotide mutase n=1 Tax=Candidatus Danuiimicrobium aquiferis TaxID=1801832 RepID=A0A1G1KWS0_9BACT|nr:MAG: 5-(carboxyamino)imidazole ribonucleotide mutase [Omnitrophica bacterium RIFCSPHIGHO2_02_FULL_45_28]OGW90269.1 MAG: 5-(carboxyamino)imidazole ribonucleotide mutase [Omnitrophica bacterium RIFCSPHIGHO2_12_FULL_44_12]OGW97242.1 MAG: 5-(carboxyamino)imidazole ribonucleotide mutase [Omnitrophica bacterium RIFCSPLOWO2_12_FULL_44_17]OGX02297.1 MAG: 5-(carboxyamino)imidazole ribonucleotide mutase [Omnitrophica bacterium RIFCSPLOWO2_02_FULL_44_11]
MAKIQVSIVMGSDNDFDIMNESRKILSHFGVESEVRILSAHRSPDLVAQYAKSLSKRGVQVVIAGAGGAAHLAGVIAAHTTLPVIGVPINATSLNGFDSLLSIVQMPAGIPVATVAVGKAGAINAGILAAQILAIGSKALQQKLLDHKKKCEESVEEKDKKIQKRVQ